MTTALLFYLSNKDLEEIQLILTFTKAANLVKRAIDVIGDLTMMVKKKWPLQQPPRSKLNKECFNHNKKSYYARNCPSRINPKRKLIDKKTEQEEKDAR